MEMIDREIANHRQERGWAIIKINSIVDRISRGKIYEASQAGVRIHLINRGICVINRVFPGFRKIFMRFSIVDNTGTLRFMFLPLAAIHRIHTSADWMPEKLRPRIEASADLRLTDPAQLWNVLQIP